MPKLTDEPILKALQQGKTIDLNGNIMLKELLVGSEGVIYALYHEEELWRPYCPNVWELMQGDWQIKN